MSKNIIEIYKSHLKFNKDNLESILDKIPEDVPIAILSILGAFRSGKSALLNFIIDNLKNNRELDCNGNVPVPYSYNNKSFEIKKYFDSEFGHESVTKGIKICEEPIIMNVEGVNTALLVIDTQGLFDTYCNQFSTIAIFGITTLISSHIIYNIDKRIQEDHLQNIALFSEYAQIAQNFSDILPDINLLIRDFQSYDELNLNENTKFCENYLEQIFQLRDLNEGIDQEELNNTRFSILNAYNNISCNILPHPGFKFIKKNSECFSNILEDDFKICINNYIKDLKSRIKIKKLDKNNIYKDEFSNLIEKYIEVFNNCENFPNAQTLLNSTYECHLSNLQRKSIKIYKKEMSKKTHNSYCFESTLKTFHKEVFEKVINEFDTKKIVDKYNNKYIDKRQELINNIDDCYKNIIISNRYNNPINKLNEKVSPLTLTVTSLAVQSASYTCYNTLDVCAVSYFGSSFTLFLGIGLLAYNTLSSYNYNFIKEKAL